MTATPLPVARRPTSRVSPGSSRLCSVVAASLVTFIRRTVLRNSYCTLMSVLRFWTSNPFPYSVRASRAATEQPRGYYAGL